MENVRYLDICNAGGIKLTLAEERVVARRAVGRAENRYAWRFRSPDSRIGWAEDCHGRSSGRCGDMNRARVGGNYEIGTPNEFE